MKKSFINIILTVLILLPVLSAARISHDGSDPGVQRWVGGWYGSNGVYHSVSGHSFIHCDTLIYNATQGLSNVTIVECHRI